MIADKEIISFLSKVDVIIRVGVVGKISCLKGVEIPYLSIVHYCRRMVVLLFEFVGEKKWYR